MQFADDIADGPVAGREDIEVLLEELEAASRLMEKIAAASGVLPAQYRQKADRMGKNMKTLYETGRRRLGDVSP